MENQVQPEVKSEEQPALKMEHPKDYIELKEIEKRFGIEHDEGLALARSQFFPSFHLSKTKFLIPRKAFEAFITSPERIIEYKQKTYLDKT